LQIETAVRNANLTLPTLPQHSQISDPDQLAQFYHQFAQRVQTLSQDHLKTRVEDLIRKFGPHEPLIVYVDEAHEFSQRYWALQRVLWTLNAHETLWFAFMGTNTSLAEFVPASSDRSFSLGVLLCIT
jgi:hypothetical protein